MVRALTFDSGLSRLFLATYFTISAGESFQVAGLGPGMGQSPLLFLYPLLGCVIREFENQADLEPSLVGNEERVKVTSVWLVLKLKRYSVF